VTLAVTGATVFPISAPLDEGMEPVLDAIIEWLGAPSRESDDEGGTDRPWTPL
jgi:GTP-binding protein